MPRPRSFLFSVPSLPKDVYLKMNELRAVLDLSQWQAVILGIQAALVVGRELGEERLKALAEEVRGKYRVPGESVERP